MGKKSNKGGAFERKMSEDLSLWWSDGIYDDLFWRTAGSGSRATGRHSRTKNQSGDIGAVAREGESLTKLCVIECKDGYADKSPLNLIDTMETYHNRKKLPLKGYEEWLAKVSAEARKAQIPYWMFIHHRNNKKTLLTIPYSLGYKLAVPTEIQELMKIRGYIWQPRDGGLVGDPMNIFTMDWEEFKSVYCKKEFLKRCRSTST